jgi:hypothetical protein
MIMVYSGGRRLAADRTQTTLPRDQRLDVVLADPVSRHHMVMTLALALPAHFPGLDRSRFDGLAESAFEIVDRTADDHRVILELAEAAIAPETQQPPVVAGGVIMIDMQGTAIETDHAKPALTLGERSDLDLSEAISTL